MLINNGLHPLLVITPLWGLRKTRALIQFARELLLKEGNFVGSSTGVLVSAALKYAAEQNTPKKIVTFACDTGNKYLFEEVQQQLDD